MIGRNAQSFLLFLLLLLFGVGEAQGRVVSARLAEQLSRALPGEQIPVLVTLKDQVDLQSYRSALKSLRKQIKKAQRKQRKVLLRKLKRERKLIRRSLVRALRSKADLSQKDLLRLLRSNRAGRIKPLWIINGIALRAPPQLIELLAQLPQVAKISSDVEIRAPQAQPASIGGTEPGLLLSNIPDLWSLGLDGQGLVVATLDSGVDIQHPDLAGRWRGGSNSWFDPNGEHPSVPYDHSGHGTGVMGVLVGGSASGTAIGVAPGAEWIAVKIFDDADVALNSKIHEGFQWLLDPDGDPATDDAPDIVNNSWSFAELSGQCVDQSSPNPNLDLNFHPDIAALQAAGIEVIFSAGNSGPAPGSSESPANYPEALAVGSIGSPTSASEVSSFSSRGPSACDGSVFPDLVAPGYNISLADLTLGGTNPNPYRIASGTSFAAPQVAGLVALLRQAFPAASLAELQQALQATASDLGSVGADNDYGYGQVDGLAAYHYLAGDPLAVELLETAAQNGSFDYAAVTWPAAGDYEYEFWLYDPAVGWSQAQAYSSLASWNWTPPAAPGNYRIAVNVRQQGGTLVQVAVLEHQVAPPAISAVDLTETPQVGGSFIFLATPSGGSAPYEYEFWLHDPASGWSQVQTYSTSASWHWTPPATPGTYTIAVNARSQGSSVVATAVLSHVVEPPPIAAVQLSESSGSGGLLVYSATPSGGSAPYEYEFWLHDPASGWSQVQAYSTSSGWTWTPPTTAGRYTIAVNARSQGSTIVATAVLSHVVEPPPISAVSLVEASGSGGSFLFTASPVGGSAPYEYEFWLRDPATGWGLVQAYSTSAGWAWTPPATPGSYTIAVNARSQGSSVVVTAVLSHIVEPPPIASVQLNESSGSGGRIYTATPSGGSAPYEYEFWLYDPSSGWSQVQAYSTSSSWSWNPPAVPGIYRIAVNARSQGSTTVVVDLLIHTVP